MSFDLVKLSDAPEGVEEDLFAPIPYNAIEGLLREYSALREQIEALGAQAKSEDFQKALPFFVRDTKADSVLEIFDVDRALKNLNSTYWRRALRVSGIFEDLPAKRRSDWEKQMDSGEAPDFFPTTVVETLKDLWLKLPQFLAERVDGIFNSLSPVHVTNSPVGFRKRMIINYVFEQDGWPVAYSIDVIHDLREVIAKIQGLEVPCRQTTHAILTWARKDTGVWHDVDGFSWRLRTYLKGTAHIEIHEDMAWRLNAILSYLYPNALADDSRKPPTKTEKKKEVELIRNVIPHPILEVLRRESAQKDGHHYKISLYSYAFSKLDKHLQARVVEVLEAIGGVVRNGSCIFDYDPNETIQKIVMLGQLPDQKSFQYYPTPEHIAERMVFLAYLRDGLKVLEPSAGTGSIADQIAKVMNRDAVDTIEVSELHQEVLKSKGFNVVASDFLSFTPESLYDRIVMNPPYSEGRWKEHLDHAVRLLNPEGKLVALLPSNQAIHRLEYEGCSVLVQQDNISFPGVSIKVAIVIVAKSP